MDLTTPALLFPAISLLMLAYTNRFIVLANLARELYAEYQETEEPGIAAQIVNLQIRNGLIKNMQICGAVSFALCVVCMFLLFAKIQILANIAFVFALLFLLLSLGLLIRELQLSIDALNTHLSDFTKHPKQEN